MSFEKMGFIRVISLFFLILIIQSCTSDSPEPTEESGTLSINFNHEVDGVKLTIDTLAYINDAGNKYLVNEIQYFISDVYLISSNNDKVYLNNWNNIHYIDTDIEETRLLQFNEQIPVGSYEGIGFTFGINEEKNQSLMFVNPPESFMFWPENLGGGYHYLKLNGKWINTDDQLAPFNFHLGIGQLYYSYPDSISEYIHNHFEVELHYDSIRIVSGNETSINMFMNVNDWFRSPNVYDHNLWGGDIMQNQEAMSKAVENGADVFYYDQIK